MLMVEDEDVLVDSVDTCGAIRIRNHLQLVAVKLEDSLEIISIYTRRNRMILLLACYRTHSMEHLE